MRNDRDRLLVRALVGVVLASCGKPAAGTTPTAAGGSGSNWGCVPSAEVEAFRAKWEHVLQHLFSADGDEDRKDGHVCWQFRERADDYGISEDETTNMGEPIPNLDAFIAELKARRTPVRSDDEVRAVTERTHPRQLATYATRTGMPPTGDDDPKLNQRFLTVAQFYWEDGDPPLTVKKCTITGTGWQVFIDPDTKVASRRRIAGACAVEVSPEVCVVFYDQCEQVYVGGGNFNEGCKFIAANFAEPEKVDCKSL